MMDHLPSDGPSEPAEQADPPEQVPPLDASRPDSADAHRPSETDSSGREELTASQWLSEEDFISKTPDPAGEPLPLLFANGEQRLPGPGLPEAILWVGGVVMVHLFGGAVTAAVLIVAQGSATGAGDPRELMRSMQSMLELNLVPLMAGEMLIFVLCAVLACGLRLRPRMLDRLGSRSIPVRHLLWLIVLWLPLSFSCGQLYWWAMIGWQKIVILFPALQRFDELNSTEAVVRVAGQASFPMLLFLVALLPAVGEELVFRGVIGRGLVARWGVVRGVALTSLFFVAVHLHPAHAVALIPLAVCIHLVYLATRSFWAPVALHFLNNAWATVLLKSPGLETRIGLETSKPIPWGLFAISAVCALLVTIVIWRSRLRYVLPDDTCWNPGYATVELPPADLHAVARCRRAERGLIVAAALSVAGFAAALSLTIASGGQI